MPCDLPVLLVLLLPLSPSPFLMPLRLLQLPLLLCACRYYCNCRYCSAPAATAAATAATAAINPAPAAVTAATVAINAASAVATAATALRLPLLLLRLALLLIALLFHLDYCHCRHCIHYCCCFSWIFCRMKTAIHVVVYFGGGSVHGGLRLVTLADDVQI